MAADAYEDKTSRLFLHKTRVSLGSLSPLFPDLAYSIFFAMGAPFQKF
jgi:hypothetical protein